MTAPLRTWAEQKANESDMTLEAKMESRREWLSAMRDQYPTQTAMAEGLGICRATLFHIARSCGLKLPAGKAGKRIHVTPKAITSCATKGMTLDQAAEAIGAHPSYLRLKAREMGVRFKRKPRAPKPVPAPAPKTMTLADYAALENAAMLRRRSA